MIATTRIASALLLAAAGCTLTACSSPESKVESFSKRGQALLAQGDPVKARLEFQNALQINPSAVPALFGLAAVAERARDWPAEYQLLTKVVELQPTHLQALVKLGKLELASGQLAKALETSQAARSVAADNTDVQALQAAVFLKLGEPQKAVALATTALGKDPRHLDALVVRATERLQAGDVEGGIAFLDKGLENNQRNVSLQLLKVQALEKATRIDRAEQVLHQLVTLFPDNSEYRGLLASFYVKHGQPAKAEAEYRALAAAAGTRSVAPRLQLVQFLAAARGVAPAAAELENFVRAEPKSQELKLALANLRLQQKDDAAAIAVWKDIIAAGGDDAAVQRARGALAAYYLTHNDTAAAKALVDQILAKDVRNEQGLFLRAGIAADAGKLDDAIGDLRTILRDAPQSARAHLLLANAHEMQGSRDLAMQHYASAAQSSGFAPAFALPYATQLVRTGKARQAEGVLREVLRIAPGNVTALKLLAESHLRSGDLAAAQAVADELAKGETAPVASQIRGAVQFARKDFDGGIASFRRAQELAPADPQAMTTVVRGYLVAGKPKDALAFVRTVHAAAPQNVQAQVLQGQLLAHNGDIPGAIAFLQAGLQRDPAQPMLYQALVGVHLQGRNPAEAMKVVDAGLRAVPNDFSLRLARAGVLDAMGRTDEAIAAYDALLAERPNAVVVANNLASLLADNRKDSASVRRAYTIAQRFRASDIPLLKDTVGWTTHLAGKHREAADLLKAAAAQAPDLAVVHYHYGMNQLTLNNVETAKASLRRSLELARTSPFPQAEDARKTLQGL